MPIPTRHRAVLTLGRSYPLYTQPVPRNESGRHLLEAMFATPSFHITSLSTSQRLTSDNNFIDKIVINFWSNDKIVYTEIVSIPKTWSPRMFLAAVYTSIKTHRVCSIESYEIRNIESTTINDVHFLFPNFFYFSEETTMYYLIRSGAFYFISGGEIV